MVDIEAALAWAADSLGAPVVSWQPMTGGLTSTMLALCDASGGESVLRLMTEEPWRSHGAELTARERTSMEALAGTEVPVPTSRALDAEGRSTGVAAHLMSRLPGARRQHVDDAASLAMADLLAAIHEVRPDRPFRPYQSWAWPAKWVVPTWTRQPDSWRRAFSLLAEQPPDFVATFLHRDYGHHNLLWTDGSLTGVVDWVETSTGPAWLDAGHAATNLAVAFGTGAAVGFLEHYAAATSTSPQPYWLVMDAVGFLPPPGREPMFGDPGQLERLDEWLDLVVRGDLS